MRKPPERTCIGCKAICPASELVCLVAPDGRVCLARRGPGQTPADGAGKKRGRGAWVHPRCLPTAIKVLGRAFRRQVEIPQADALLAQMHVASGRSIDAQDDSR